MAVESTLKLVKQVFEQALEAKDPLGLIINMRYHDTDNPDDQLILKTVKGYLTHFPGHEDLYPEIKRTNSDK